MLKLRSLEAKKLPANWHFWIIILLTIFIILIYYTWQEWFPWFWGYFVYVEYVNGIIGLSLFLIPFLYASIVFWWRGPVIIGIFYLLAMLPVISNYYYSVANMFRNIALLISPVAIVAMIALQINWHNK